MNDFSDIFLMKQNVEFVYCVQNREIAERMQKSDDPILIKNVTIFKTDITSFL